MHFPNFIKLSTCLGVIALAMLQNKAWGANAVPVVQPDPMDRSTVTAWSGQIMGKMNALGSPPSRMDVATVPLGQMRSLADRVRNELRERSGDRHLLYLGPSSRGHMYAFPLTRTEHGLRLVTGPPDRYSQMALISVSPRGHGERSIYLHDIVGAWIPNKNIMYQNLMGANAYHYSSASMVRRADLIVASGRLKSMSFRPVEVDIPFMQPTPPVLIWLPLPHLDSLANACVYCGIVVPNSLSYLESGQDRKLEALSHASHLQSFPTPGFMKATSSDLRLTIFEQLSPDQRLNRSRWLIMRIKSARLLLAMPRLLSLVLVATYLLNEPVLAAGDDEKGKGLEPSSFIFESSGPARLSGASSVPRRRSRLSAMGSPSTPGSSSNPGFVSHPGSSSNPGSSSAPGMSSDPLVVSDPAQAAPPPTIPEIEIVPPSVHFPPFINIVPIPEHEPWHMYRQFRYRLAQLDIDHRSLALLNPRADFVGDHRTMLRDQLQAQVDLKHALVLTPTIDHGGRVYAVPIFRDSVKEALIGSKSHQNVGWALIGIWPGRQTSVAWFGYALLDVRGRASLIQKLQDSVKVKVLADLLRPIPV
ncbi:hypothetical protein PaG_01237 [Moesziomyces aphidis]|uniref:Uncharacterized protein n=1 Tax=Moesziomyces aphidis TaxID=84754 RepID=W3VS65_MOEAP|nr:hypothetical protein PaG_01237 [Moesziomyces aphidis]